jgi:hypothetical protein
MADEVRHFDELYREHYNGLERYMRRRVNDDTASDLVAEVFMVAWRRIHEVPRTARRHASTSPPRSTSCHRPTRRCCAWWSGSSSVSVTLPRSSTRTGRLPAERTTGFEHIKISAWYLDTMVDGKQVTSLVIPRWTETWRGPDGTGSITTGVSKPLLRTQEDRNRWDRLGRPGEHPDATTEPLQPNSRISAGAAPADRDAMARYLAVGHPAENGPDETLVAITDLVRERVLGPAQRAALLRVLAGVPGLKYVGTTVDRAGRKGEAFTLRNSRGGLLNDHTLIVDPATGRLLDAEMLLLERGLLDVWVPGIIEYEVYTVSEFADR